MWGFKAKHACRGGDIGIGAAAMMQQQQQQQQVVLATSDEPVCNKKSSKIYKKWTIIISIATNFYNTNLISIFLLVFFLELLSAERRWPRAGPAIGDGAHPDDGQAVRASEHGSALWLTFFKIKLFNLNFNILD